MLPASGPQLALWYRQCTQPQLKLAVVKTCIAGLKKLSKSSVLSCIAVYAKLGCPLRRRGQLLAVSLEKLLTEAFGNDLEGAYYVAF